MSDLVERRFLKIASMQAQANHKLALVGWDFPIPALKDIPTGATPEQIACASAAGVVYLNDVLDCLQLTNEAQARQCVKAAYTLYCKMFETCFPA